MSTRREILKVLGVGAAAVAAPTLGGEARAQAGSAEGSWDLEADVVCVGSGAAAGSAAVFARDLGASVVVLEKMPIAGGTTARSSAVTWVPNNRFLREQGISDARQDCLQYLARYAYPNAYDTSSPTLGLAEEDFDLLAAFYDHAAPAIERLESLGIAFKQFRMFQVDRPAPDYADHLPENRVPTGRALVPAASGSLGSGGRSLIDQFEAWWERQDVPLLTDTEVTRLVLRDGRVAGVAANTPEGPIRVGARRGVIFGTGGYVHHQALSTLHQPALYGSCAAMGATGDFLRMAGEIGAGMGALHTAWRTQVVLEEALRARFVPAGCNFVPGDSMILVNRYGHRVVNEKRCYNDRTRAHFAYDSTREEYPNHLLFMIFDERCRDLYAGSFPIPLSGTAAHLISADDLTGLASRLDHRLAEVAARTGGVRLAGDFAGSLAATMGRYNRFAAAGRDDEFGRGAQLYDREWDLVYSRRREPSVHASSPRPSHTMTPLGPGPFHAVILAPGALDTNAGPRIDAAARVLNVDGRPIPGLYGAGNCIASPTRGAYFGAGGTIGPAIAFGYIAAHSAVGAA